MQIDGVACRMGRAALAWSHERLADGANLFPGVISDYECGSKRCTGTT
jgi:predicted transcriptional regulator